MLTNQRELPKYLLKNICWDFTNQDIFVLRAEFEDAVRQYNVEALEGDESYNFEDEFNFQETILETPVVIVNYLVDPLDEEEHFHIVEIESDNKTSFSNGELFYKFHNIAVTRLKESYHCYFEGLDFVEINATGIPIYEMIGGS